MTLHTVDLAELKVSDDPDVALVTYGLGSCIALVAHDPVRRVGGMLHYMLPQASVSPEKAAARPGMFADTGVPLLLQAMVRQGCSPGRLTLKAVGGARCYDALAGFDIGRRNYLMLRKLLWRAGLLTAAEDVGGSRSRTVRLEVGSGRVTVRSEGIEAVL